MVRLLLSQCRHAREELAALRREMALLGWEGADRADGGRTALRQRERAAVERLACLEEMIGSLPDPRARTVMRYGYVLGWPDSRIGEEMALSEEWVRKKRYAAVRAMERAHADAENCAP